MDEGPPSQVAVSRSLLVFFFPSSNRRAGQSTHTNTHTHTHTHTRYIFFIEAVGRQRGRDGAEGADGGVESGPIRADVIAVPARC